jgi:hypothetical protein
MSYDIHDDAGNSMVSSAAAYQGSFCEKRAIDPSGIEVSVMNLAAKATNLSCSCTYHENVVAASEGNASAARKERAKDEARGLKRVTWLAGEFHHRIVSLLPVYATVNTGIGVVCRQESLLDDV